MSLPTPPNTSHRTEKESRALRVAWAEENCTHLFSASPPQTPDVKARQAIANGPSKPILKPSLPLLPWVVEDSREITPEPSSPLSDPQYLEGPVSMIIAVDASLRNLIEGYSRLVNRLRAVITEETPVDESYPLFQPIRSHREALVEAMSRDLGRALVDPQAISTSKDEEDVAAISLPSPRGSPKKKKGMTAEQVTYARDLCTTCHSVMRLCAFMFALPAVHQLFTDDQLGFLMTQVLAIPLAQDLPTPNARKTWGLAILLIQVQRLPHPILKSAAPRITYALQRAIEGRLGKEGKKGSITDGLRAIHDLSLEYPDIFVPAFADILPSILEALLAPTLTMRSAALHALGGFTFSYARCAPSAINQEVSDLLVEFVAPLPEETEDAPESPKTAPLAPIIRTLRTVLIATDPKGAAQGPVWAWCLLACITVLLGPAVFKEERVMRTLMALHSLGMRHPKSSVRGLGCLVWRALGWAYMQLLDTEDAEEYLDCESKVWKAIKSVVDMGAGVSIIGALLASNDKSSSSSAPSAISPRLTLAIDVLRAMSAKGGLTCKEAMDTLSQLVSPAGSRDVKWDERSLNLLPKNLFSTLNGLQAAEFGKLAQVVRPILRTCPGIEDVRSLRVDELADEDIWTACVEVWEDGVKSLQMCWGMEIPAEVQDIWYGLLKGRITVLGASGSDEQMQMFGVTVYNILIRLLDSSVQLSMDSDDSENTPTSPIKKVTRSTALSKSRSDQGLRLVLVRQLWAIVKDVFPPAAIVPLAQKLLTFVCDKEETLAPNPNTLDEVREQWAWLCADVTYSCDEEELVKFWTGKKLTKPSSRYWNARARSAMWIHFVELYKDYPISLSYTFALVLLSVPFIPQSHWQMTSEHLEAWDKLLQLTIRHAASYNIDAPSVLDSVATAILLQRSPVTTTSTRVADLLLSHLELDQARAAPGNLMQFVNSTLASTYPPAPRNKIVSTWLVRSLTRVVDACPAEILVDMLEAVQEGMAKWISDENEVFTADEYSMDMLPLYQTVLLTVHSLPAALPLLERLSTVIEAPFQGRQNKPIAVSHAFAEFWQDGYAELPEPAQGWPETITRCLRAISTPVEEDTLPSSDEAYDLPSADDEAYDADRSLDSDESPMSDDLPVASSPLYDPFLDSDLSVASPPSPHASLPISTPPRQAKPAAPFLSPLPPSSPIREPTTPRSAGKRGSGSAHRRRGKENVSPLPAFALRGPDAPSSVLGKRRLLAGAGEEQGPAKRSRASLPLERDLGNASSSDDGEASEVEQLLDACDGFSEDLASGLGEPSTPTSKTPLVRAELEMSPEIPMASEFARRLRAAASSPPVNKRKRVFMQCVELPTFEEVLEQARRPRVADGRPHSQRSYAESAKRATAALRRTRSSTDLFGSAVALERLPSTPTKKRKILNLPAEEDALLASSSPVRRLSRVVVAGSDDSILASPRSAPQPPSSDDEPRLGQVTPHHLVSPALRRARPALQGDPPSDDSSVGSSPSRVAAARRLARTGSGNFESVMKPTPLRLGAKPAV